MRRKREHTEQARSSGDGRLTPAEIQQVEFRLAFRGYNERDVDAFLDRITEDLSTYIEENNRLRSGAGASPPEAEAAGNGSAAAAREADEIVARAKERAAQMVSDTEAAAASVSASAGVPSAAAGGTDPRAAIAPFLNREREFLQSLGGLVQGHAEEIKEMVLVLRKKAGSDARAFPTASPQPLPRPEPVILTEEMESARTGGPEPVPAERPSGERPSGERSLRDLFWGED